MAFENNQQDAFNLRNDTERMKQFEAELNKATTSIGAAEIAAERDLAELKLANLDVLHKEKLKKLDKLLDEELAGIQLLAEARLQLSDKQFKVRKKQIQDELQLLKDAVDELHKVEDKNANTTDKATEDSSSTKPAARVTSSKTEISELISSAKSLTEVVSDLRDAITSNSWPSKKDSSEDKNIAPSAVEGLKETGTSNQTNKTTSSGDSSNNNTGIVGEDANRGNEYTSDAGKMEAVDLGRFSGEDVLRLFDANREYMDSSISSIFNAFNKVDKDGKVVTDKNGNAVPEFTGSQVTLDFAGELLTSVEQTEATRQKLQEFTENKVLNFRLITAKREQDKKNKYLEEYQALLMEAGEYAVDQADFEKDRARKENKAAKKEAVGGITDGLKKFGTGEFSLVDVQQSYGKYMGQRTDELQAAGMDESSAKLTANFELLAEAAGSLAKVLDSQVKEISSMQGIVDTRLQGSKANDRDFINGSYWNELLEEIKWIAGASPFVKQEKIVENVKALIDKGISFDVKQRAFLMTIQEKIANTFDVADGTLLRLIRIQQQDTTAGRLGMESALNSFLNSMYETSEYLSDVASSVRSSLFEMQAFESGDIAAELEFQVQKWMGSLYSVGMSQEAVQGIAQAFGQITSGDVSGLTGNGTGNLLIMAANEAGISIADILQEGLKADETNELMQAMVNYLAEIAETSSDSRVVQQQLANVYGIKASDLKAATNLATSLSDVAGQDLTYGGMVGQLKHMMNTIRFRTSIGEGMTNMWDNMMYSMASTQASNPMLYLLPKMADLLRDVTGGGGIALPGISVMGNMVDLHTSVADLMSVASMAGTALGAIGPVLLGLTDLVNPLVGTTMLMRAGIETSGKAPVIARGTPAVLKNVSGSGISESGQIVGQSSGDDIKKQTLQGAEDDKKKQLVEAKDEEASTDLVTKANQAVIDIYSLLEEVAHGSQSLRVRVINSNDLSGTAQTNTTMNTDNGNWVLS